MESLNENHVMPLKSEEEFSLRKGKKKKKTIVVYSKKIFIK